MTQPPYPPGPYRPGPPAHSAGPPPPHPGPPQNGPSTVVVLVLVVVVVLGVVFGYLLAGRLGLVPVPNLPGPQPPTSQTSSVPLPSGGPPVGVEGTLAGAGSSWAEPAMQRWIDQAERANPELTVEYLPTGSGAGNAELLSGNVQFAITDRPIEAADVAAAGSTAVECAPIHLPVLANLVAFVVEIPGVRQLNLDAPTLAGIYQGELTSWDDPAIGNLNPDLALPSLPIVPLYRSDSAALNQVVGQWLATAPGWPHEATPQFPAAVGTGVQGNSGVVQAMVPGAIGYLMHGTQLSLTSARLGNGGEFIEPESPEATAGLAASPIEAGRAPNDLVIEIDRDLPGGYPLVQLGYLAICSADADAAVTQAAQALFGWALTEQGQQAASDVGAAPLPRELAQQADTHLAELG